MLPFVLWGTKSPLTETTTVVSGVEAIGFEGGLDRYTDTVIYMSHIEEFLKQVFLLLLLIFYNELKNYEILRDLNCRYQFTHL